jgi:glycerol-3-phosphate dehydrogenase
LVNIWSSSIYGLSRLIHGAEKDIMANITYPYAIERSKSGLISPLGGSWTLFRRIGEDTVDYIIKEAE